MRISTYVRNAHDKEGVFPKRILEFGTIEAIIGCVKAGMGVAVMMKSIVSNYNSLTLTPLPQPYRKVPTFYYAKRCLCIGGFT